VKKWTKGKVKEKVNNAVFLDKAGYDKIIADIPKQSKAITIATVIEKFKISGSIARVILRTLIQNGSLRRVDPHSKQFICVSTAAPKKVETAEVTKGGKPAKQQKGKKGE
jgi:small subunit ribosomal protein S25e